LLAFHLPQTENDSDIYIISNSARKTEHFKLPKIFKESLWALAVDTSKDSPQDIFFVGGEVQLEDQEKYEVKAQTTVVLIAKKF
jgi:hypothetical protein